MTISSLSSSSSHRSCNRWRYFCLDGLLLCLLMCRRLVYSYIPIRTHEGIFVTTRRWKKMQELTSLVVIAESAEASMRISIMLSPRTLGYTSSVSSSLWSRKGDENNDDEEEEGLSELDARVLQSLLQDTASSKLDLQQEVNMKRLLERGIKAKQKVKSPKDTKKLKGNSEYSSQVVQTLADTKLWKALSRNAQDILETAKIALVNRLERDTKLVASLGIFALERALQDVSRALPATTSSSSTARKKKKNIFQLTDKSSYEEKEEEEVTTKIDIRKEFTTPQDEIKDVQEKIKQIFQQADMKKQAMTTTTSSSSSSSSSTPSVLRSTTRRGNTRLIQAYNRQQQAKIKKEKENIVQKTTRLTSNVIDNAYQLQSEITKAPELNPPGYKTKRLRQATTTTASKLLASASAAVAGTNTFLLNTGKTDSNKQSTSNQNGKGNNNIIDADISSNIDSTINKGFSSTAIPSSKAISTEERDTSMDATAAAMDAAFKTTARTAENTTPSMTEQQPIRKINNNDGLNVIDAQVTADPVAFLDEQPYFAFKRGQQPTAGTASSSTTTKTPAQLVKEQQTNAVFSSDVSSATRPMQQEEKRKPQYITAEVISPEIEQEQELNISGDYFYNGYGYGDDGTILRTDVDDNVMETVNDLLDNDEVDIDDNLRQVIAEVISEEEFDDTIFGQAKVVNNLSPDEVFDDEEDRDKDPNLFVIVTLRSLDVVFLIAEKTILLIPDVLAFTNRVVTRVAEVKREGMGQNGWEPLKMKIRGEKRY